MPPKSSKAPSHDEVLKLSEETMDLLESLWSHPLIERGPRPAVPSMLWNASDSVRRTYVDCIIPNLPPAKAAAFVDSKCEQVWRTYPGTPHFSPPVVQGEAANEWPTPDKEKLADILSRNMLVSKIILEPNNIMVQMMFRGDSGFDFGEDIKTKARKLTK